MDYDKILEFADDNSVQLAASFKDEIGKTLALGMTSYVCKNGTLSDGHMKITQSQRYYQAIKEMWALKSAIETTKVNAMKAQADLMDAEEVLEKAEKKSDKLRAEAKILEAKSIMTNALVTIQDQTRMMKAFNEVRLELKPIVEKQYPQGIEQAEPDNWKAVMEYQILQKQVGYQHILSHLPLPKYEKAKLSLEHNMPEAAAWLFVDDKNEIESLLGKSVKKITREELLDYINKKESKLALEQNRT